MWNRNWDANTPGGEQDIYVEVNHGPLLVDNNIFLSPYSVHTRGSQGDAYVHNIFAGAFRIIHHDRRQTPFHKAHSTDVVALHDNPCGDNRFYNNLFVGHGDLRGFDAARFPVSMDGNVFVKGAKPSKHEQNPLMMADGDPALKLIEKDDGFYFEINIDKGWSIGRTRPLVTTELLGKTKISDAAFENPDGKPLCVNVDYFGKPRDEANPTPGPFENPGEGLLKLKVWGP